MEARVESFQEQNTSLNKSSKTPKKNQTERERERDRHRHRHKRENDWKKKTVQNKIQHRGAVSGELVGGMSSAEGFGAGSRHRGLGLGVGRWLLRLELGPLRRPERRVHLVQLRHQPSALLREGSLVLPTQKQKQKEYAKCE